MTTTLADVSGHARSRPATAAELLFQMRAFALPGGEAAARAVRAVRLTQRGEVRSSPEARWVPFTAEQTIEAQVSAFRWEAHPQRGLFRVATVVDAYEHGHGALTTRLAGALLSRASGVEFDRGEIQRYLAELPLCPPALVAHPGLAWVPIGARTLRVRDGADATDATVDLELAADGRVVRCSALRPRAVERAMVVTPWSGTYAGERTWEDLRVPVAVEVSWHLPAESYVYFRGEVTSFTALR
jgi:hypothetical protein